jgi:hypothetical protein
MNSASSKYAVLEMVGPNQRCQLCGVASLEPRHQPSLLHLAEWCMCCQACWMLRIEARSRMKSIHKHPNLLGAGSEGDFNGVPSGPATISGAALDAAGFVLLAQ